MDLLLHRIEWTTLLFFASMFVTLECLERLGLVHWFSEHTISLISASDNENTQLIIAIFILIWVSLTVYTIQYILGYFQYKSRARKNRCSPK